MKVGRPADSHAADTPRVTNAAVCRWAGRRSTRQFAPPRSRSSVLFPPAGVLSVPRGTMGSMSREFQVTFDAADPIDLSLFWAEVLGYVVQPPPGSDLPPETPAAEVVEAWMSFLTATGVPRERHRAASALVDPTGSGPRVFFQQVPEPKTAKNRVHLDVRAAPGLAGDERMAALEAECERLISLGAKRLRRFEPEPPISAGFIVMADPAGNEFCLD